MGKNLVAVLLRPLRARGRLLARVLVPARRACLSAGGASRADTLARSSTSARMQSSSPSLAPMRVLFRAWEACWDRHWSADPGGLPGKPGSQQSVRWSSAAAAAAAAARDRFARGSWVRTHASTTFSSTNSSSSSDSEDSAFASSAFASSFFGSSFFG